MSTMMVTYKIQERNQKVHQSDTLPSDIVDLGIKSIIIMPENSKSFWSKASNKHQLKIASRKCFDLFLIKKIKFLVDMCLTNNGRSSCRGSWNMFFNQRSSFQKHPSYCQTMSGEVKTVVVTLNNTDVIIYSLAYHQIFHELGLEEFSVNIGI